MCQLSVTEDFEEYRYYIKFSSKEDLNSMQTQADQILKIKHKTDSLNLEVFDHSLNEQSFYEPNIETIDLQLISAELDEDSDEFELRLTIRKNNLSIYSLNKFLDYVINLEFKYILNNFNLFTKNPPESLNIVELDSNLHSSLCLNEGNQINRQKYISVMGDSVNAFGFPSHSLLPNDFDFNWSQINNSSEHVGAFFIFIEKLKGLLSLFYLCDFIELEQNNIILNINNTYTLRCKFDYSKLTFSSTHVVDELFKVYRWVYENKKTEHIQDKLELARIQLAKNITITDNSLDINTKNIIANLNSMYKIYLKENVDKYIDATNRVAEIVSDITYKQNEITASFTNSLKTNSTLLIGFFISLVVYNNLAAGETSIFNNSNFMLVVLFTMISAITLILSFYQVNRNLGRTIDYFNKQKDIYAQLFSQDDIELLFSDGHLKQMKRSVKFERNLYGVVWVGELIAIFLASFIATYYPNLPQQLFEWISSFIC